jgi:hypothetical protein
MRRAMRRSLLVCVAALLASTNASRQAAALFMPEHDADRPILIAAKSKLSPKERAAEAARKKHEANAKLSHIWVLGRDGARPALSYARANGDDVKVTLSCEIEAGLVRVVVYDVPAKGMRPGDGGRVRLSNGPARVEVAATALPNDKNSRAVDLGGITKVSPRLFSLIKTGDTMVIEVPGRTTGVPLKTLGAKAEAFERACLARR